MLNVTTMDFDILNSMNTRSRLAESCLSKIMGCRDVVWLNKKM